MLRRSTVAAFVAALGALAVALSLRSDWPSAPAPAAVGSPATSAAVGGSSKPLQRPTLPSEELIPTRVKRLSNAEYNGSIAALLGTKLAPGDDFAPDARQSGFTQNESQRVDSVIGKQLFSAAEKLAKEARGRVSELAPCPTPDDPEACARSFIASFGARAYRRPLEREETRGLLDVYRAGALDASYGDGIELVIRAVVQSAGLLYLTELGDSNAQTVSLTGHELASSLSYLMTGGPPDQQLLDAAASGELYAPESRRHQLQRLRRERPESRTQLVRMLREWLQLDAIETTPKDIMAYPQFELVRQFFVAESFGFTAAVLDRAFKPTSDLETLLAADWTLGDKTLAQFYGDAEQLPGGGLKLAKRRGILNQGAFLSVQAHARESAPVLRGVLIARRLACIPVPPPQTRGIVTLPPPPDPKLTTRERFDLHATNPNCAECHDKTDVFGNSFEQYDGIGALRQVENGAPVDSKTEIAIGADFDGNYADSNALAEALAASPSVRECFARYLYRAASARSVDSSGAPSSVASEDAFIRSWRTLPESERGDVMGTLGAYVASPLFSQRRVL